MPVDSHLSRRLSLMHLPLSGILPMEFLDPLSALCCRYHPACLNIERAACSEQGDQWECPECRQVLQLRPMSDTHVCYTATKVFLDDAQISIRLAEGSIHQCPFTILDVEGPDTASRLGALLSGRAGNLLCCAATGKAGTAGSLCQRQPHRGLESEQSKTSTSLQTCSAQVYDPLET